MQIHTPARRRSRRTRWIIFGTMLFAALAVLPVAKALGLLPFPLGFQGLTPVSDQELGAMRGGFVLPNGIVLTFQLRFRTLVNHVQENFEVFTDTSPELEGFTGVINTVTVEPGAEPGEPAVTIVVEPTMDITGIMNVIQNNVSGVTIQNQNSLTLDLSNVNQAIVATQANNLAFRLRSLALFGF